MSITSSIELKKLELLIVARVNVTPVIKIEKAKIVLKKTSLWENDGESGPNDPGTSTGGPNFLSTRHFVMATEERSRFRDE